MPSSSFAELRRERRANGDFYATPAPFTEALLKHEKFEGSIWEPACGEGHISQVLINHGYDVRSSDLFDRGYGDAGVDFLKSTDKFDNIITNPPYIDNLAVVFTAHALSLARRKVAMYLPLRFLESPGRARLLIASPLKTVYFFSYRVYTLRYGQGDKQSRHHFCWFVWEKGWKGEPAMRWFTK